MVHRVCITHEHGTRDFEARHLRLRSSLGGGDRSGLGWVVSAYAFLSRELYSLRPRLWRQRNKRAQILGDDVEVTHITSQGYLYCKGIPTRDPLERRAHKSWVVARTKARIESVGIVVIGANNLLLDGLSAFLAPPISGTVLRRLCELSGVRINGWLLSRCFVSVAIEDNSPAFMPIRHTKPQRLLLVSCLSPLVPFLYNFSSWCSGRHTSTTLLSRILSTARWCRPTRLFCDSYCLCASRSTLRASHTNLSVFPRPHTTSTFNPLLHQS